jgi:hypothetical protein
MKEYEKLARKIHDKLGVVYMTSHDDFGIPGTNVRDVRIKVYDWYVPYEKLGRIFGSISDVKTIMTIVVGKEAIMTIQASPYVAQDVIDKINEILDEEDFDVRAVEYADLDHER